MSTSYASGESGSVDAEIGWIVSLEVPVSVVRDGYADVYLAFQVPVHRLALLLVGDRDVADEVTAEVFAKVLPKWRTGDLDKPLDYLRRAVVNEVRSRFRRRSNERRALVRYAARQNLESDSNQAESIVVLTALALLPARQRAVVALRYHDDLSEADVARVLGISIGSVKTHASRGLAQLRILLDKEER
jgi:RNA polymerase sigma factor (sigma-70 family)